MAEGTNYVEEITPLMGIMTIKIRIVRLWKPSSFENPNKDGSIEMVFLDEKGGRIQATVKKSLIRKFSDMLAEGQLRIISNFGVGENTGDFRATHHLYKINFFYSTTVNVCEENLSIPIHGFNLVSFDDILSKKLDDKFLIDIIAQVVVVGSIETIERNGKETKRLTIELNDIRATKLTCTLWDQYAEDVFNFFENNDLMLAILILQFGKIKEWRGEMTLSNTLFSTRIFLNADDIDDIALFKQRLGQNAENASVRRLTQPTQSSISMSDEFLQLHDRKTLDEIPEIDKPIYCIALATIVSLQLEHGWYYLACKKCNKKVTEDDEKILDNDGEKSATTFFCKKCNKSIVADDVIPRFKVQIRVIDESGSASFVMFDREVMSIVHKSAYDLKDSLSKVDDSDSCPEELNNLVGKKFLFKVEISDYNLKQNWEVYAVNKMSDNDDLMQSFLSTSTITKDDASNSISINYDGHKAIADVEKESISCVEDNDQLSGSSPSISIKRSIEVDSCDFEAELSTTKKKRVEIKIEKDEN